LVSNNQLLTKKIILLNNDYICRAIRGLPENAINRRETKGILGYSPLLNLPDFDIIHSIPVDEFHLLREGLTKNMGMRILIHSTVPVAKTALKRVNRVYCTMKVFSDLPRRTRSLKRLADFKGILMENNHVITIFIKGLSNRQ
jgi:hypothetical protein